MEMKFCQSCGMPLSPEVLGTNADGSKSDEYCIYCYKDGAFPRLLEMGLEPFLVSTAIKGVLAQRLVRRICKYCKEPVDISQAMRDELHLSPEMQFYHGRGCIRRRRLVGYQCLKKGRFGGLFFDMVRL